MIGDELGDVRCSLACFAQHLGSLERLTEQARVRVRDFAQALDREVIGQTVAMPPRWKGS